MHRWPSVRSEIIYKDQAHFGPVNSARVYENLCQGPVKQQFTRQGTELVIIGINKEYPFMV